MAFAAVYFFWKKWLTVLTGQCDFADRFLFAEPECLAVPIGLFK